jgi:uncharacterized protein (TIRG00374 family)
MGESMGARSASNRLIQIIFLVIAVAGLVLIMVEIDQVVTTIGQADWTMLPGALLATTLAYLCMSLSFALVGRLLGLHMEWRDLALIGFVTNVINHVVTAGGLAGYSLRYLLMKRQGISFKDVFALSALHFYLTSLDMLTMFPVGVAYLMRHAVVNQRVAALLGSLAVVLATAAVLVALLIFSQRWRHHLFQIVVRIAGRTLGRDLRGQLGQLEETMTRGALAVRRSPGQLGWVMVLTWLDWLGSAIVLGFCLDAFGPAVPFGVVVTGFVIGIVAGVASMIPGGLGVQEGSMTGVLALLGVPFGQAFLAAILFRAVFFFLPYMVSLGFSRWLLRHGQLPDAAAAG